MRRRGKGWLLLNIIFSKKFVGRYVVKIGQAVSLYSGMFCCPVGYFVFILLQNSYSLTTR
jgi:hypothetical protein